MNRRRVWSVSELITEVNSWLEEGFSAVGVEGEVTNVSSSVRGHLYFTLKDENAALDAVMWSTRAKRLPFHLEDGLAVLALGSLTVYPQRGRFQLVVTDLQPQGVGALQLAFEQLKARLLAEGLFAAERKRDLPIAPQRVGIVTSRTGAALRDMLKVLRRIPILEVVVADARVQGDGAAREVAVAVERLGGSGLVDVLVVARGGGSLEDLWAFNEEPVARAIAACPVPVVSGVGHEVDTTIADYVADVRAATPTQAAELIVSRLEDSVRRVNAATDLLARDLRRHLAMARARLAGLEGSSGLDRVPQRVKILAGRLERASRLAPLAAGVAARARTHFRAAVAGLRRVPTRLTTGGHRQLLNSRVLQIRHLVAAQLMKTEARLHTATQACRHLGPPRVLARGYSITSLEGRSVPLTDPTQVRAGQVLETTLAGGRLRSVAAGPKVRRSETKDTDEVQPSLFGEKSTHDDGGDAAAGEDHES